MKFVLLFLVLFLALAPFVSSVSEQRKHQKRTKAEKSFLILGDAGSTSTRLAFYLRNGDVLESASTCYLDAAVVLKPLVPNANDPTEHESRLGEAIKTRGAKWYAEKVGSLITAFQGGNCGTKPAIVWGDTTFKYDLMIYSTAGSRVTLNEIRGTGSSMNNFNSQFNKALTLGDANAVPAEPKRLPAHATLSNPAIVSVISGRMEGLLGFLSAKQTIEKDGTWQTDVCGETAVAECVKTKLVYYEVGGASCQLVWGMQTARGFLQAVSKNKGIIKFNNFPSNDNLPPFLYSKSFLGNGGEQAIIASKVGLNACLLKQQAERFKCAEEAVKNRLFAEGSDATSAQTGLESQEAKYARQWNKIRGFLGTETARTKVFVLNSKAVAGGLGGLKYKQYETGGAFIKAVKTYITNLLKNDNNQFPNNFDETHKDSIRNQQAVVVGLQLINILKALQWNRPVIVYNSGEWTDGAIWLLNHGGSMTKFDEYCVASTHTSEDSPFLITKA